MGAVCSFIGTVRDRNDGSAVSAMELEHYPGMTEKAIEAMIDEAHAPLRHPRRARDPPRRARCSCRTRSCWWRSRPSHRGESFQACEFLMDYLKTQAPFWKKESTPEGERWVDARVADDAALRAGASRAGTADALSSLARGRGKHGIGKCRSAPSTPLRGKEQYHYFAWNPLALMIRSQLCV